jgi:hypothetical protein
MKYAVWNWPRYHDIHTKFHKDWFSHSVGHTHSLLFFQNMGRRLKMGLKHGKQLYTVLTDTNSLASNTAATRLKHLH